MAFMVKEVLLAVAVYLVGTARKGTVPSTLADSLRWGQSLFCLVFSGWTFSTVPLSRFLRPWPEALRLLTFEFLAKNVRKEFGPLAGF